jgi:hypothetical protein
MLFLFFFSLFLTGRMFKSAVLKSYSQGKNRLVGKHEFIITPTELTDITDTGETKTRWYTLGYAETIDQYLFMTVRGSGPHIVPKRAFPNNEAFRHFAESAIAYYQASIAQQADI